MKRGLSRRKFMQIAVTAAAAGPVISCTGTRSPWRFFTVAEARTLEAACERIIPADQDPGAAWAGVVAFIDRQLMGPYKRHRTIYRQSVAGLDQSSGILFGKNFIWLAADQQDLVLARLERGDAPGDLWKKQSPQRFFELLMNHTMQGFYGDPRHGGNRDGISWRMLGLSYPPVRGRLHYDLRKREQS